MSLYSIGSFSSDGTDSIRGQAFAANVAGPNGSGGPGSATQVTIVNLSIGYATSSVTGRSNKCYVYSVPLDSVDDIGSSPNLVAESTTGAYTDGSGLFGSGTYYRQWSFTLGTIAVAATVYVYFDRDQVPRVSTNNAYGGGYSYDTDMDVMDPDCLQFQVTFKIA